MNEIDYEEAALTGPDENQLNLISELAAKQVRLEVAVAQLAADLKDKTKELAGVQDKDLPDAMLAAGCRSFMTKDGRGITIKEDISASLSEGKKPAAIEWLKENGFGDIVSQDVSVALGKGQEELAKAMQLAIADQFGVVVLNKTNVNTATLKALIRELLEKGQDVPLDTLGAYQWRKAIVK